MKSRGAVAATLVLAVCLAGCVSGASTPAPATSRASTPAASAGFGRSAAMVEAAVERGGYACAAAGTIAGFRHTECPKTGVADIDIYARADGTVAGLDAYAGGTPMTDDAMLVVLGPALDAAAGTGGWGDVADAVRAAGAPVTATTTVLPGSGLSVVVHGYAAPHGLASVAVLAPDLVAIWGHPPVPSPSPS